MGTRWPPRISSGTLCFFSQCCHLSREALFGCCPFVPSAFYLLSFFKSKNWGAVWPLDNLTIVSPLVSIMLSNVLRKIEIVKWISLLCTRDMFNNNNISTSINNFKQFCAFGQIWLHRPRVVQVCACFECSVWSTPGPGCSVSVCLWLWAFKDILQSRRPQRTSTRCVWTLITSFIGDTPPPPPQVKKVSPIKGNLLLGCSGD